jgi:transposase
MKTLSLDLRERILASYDAGRGTRQDIADRYDVSLGMVKKLLSQRKRLGDIASQYHVCGRKPYFTEELRGRIRELIRKRKDITLAEIRETLELNCSLPAIHYVLKDMNLTFKKNAARQRARTRRRGKSQGRMDGRAKSA